MKKISVIGGAGFIGTALCRLLKSEGLDFEIIDLKPSNSFPANSKTVDIRDHSLLRLAISGDVIVHLAAVHRDDVIDGRLYYETNVDGTQNICTIASERNIKKIIFTSSVAVYGFAPVGTREDGAINPFNHYGTSKFKGEEVLEAWHSEEQNSALVIVRPTVVFGEGNRGNVYNLFNQVSSGKFVMIGNGRNRKSMAYVENIAAFLLHAIKTDIKHGIFNYVDDPDFDMNTLVSKIRKTLFNRNGVGVRLPFLAGVFVGHIADCVARVTGRKLPISAIRVKKFCSSTSFRSAKEELAGFTPPFTIEQGLQRTLHSEFIDPDPDREAFFTE